MGSNRCVLNQWTASGVRRRTQRDANSSSASFSPAPATNPIMFSGIPPALQNLLLDSFEVMASLENYSKGILYSTSETRVFPNQERWIHMQCSTSRCTPSPLSIARFAGIRMTFVNAPIETILYMLRRYLCLLRNTDTLSF